MKRRAVLTAVCAGATLSAGCVGTTRLVGSPTDCRDDGTVSLSADADEFVVVTGDDRVETIRFTLENRTSCPVSVASGAWRIEREAGDGWRSVASGDGDGDRRTLARGDAHTWSLSRSPHPTPRTDTTTFVVADLPEGTYAFVVTATVGEDDRVTRRTGFTLRTRAATGTPSR